MRWKMNKQYEMQTNLYAAQRGPTLITDEEEIKQYLGILMRTEIVHMPRYCMYWSTELRCPPVSDVMPGTRFCELQKYIRFNDNTTATQNRDDPLLRQVS